MAAFTHVFVPFSTLLLLKKMGKVVFFQHRPCFVLFFLAVEEDYGKSEIQEKKIGKPQTLQHVKELKENYQQQCPWCMSRAVANMVPFFFLFLFKLKYMFILWTQPKTFKSWLDDNWKLFCIFKLNRMSGIHFLMWLSNCKRGGWAHFLNYQTKTK